MKYITIEPMKLGTEKISSQIPWLRSFDSLGKNVNPTPIKMNGNEQIATA
jgi:hypothetical protein